MNSSLSNLNPYTNCVYLAETTVIQSWTDITISGTKNLSEYKALYIAFQTVNGDFQDSVFVPMEIYKLTSVSSPIVLKGGSGSSLTDSSIGYAAIPSAGIDSKKIRLRIEVAGYRIRAYGIF